MQPPLPYEMYLDFFTEHARPTASGNRTPHFLFSNRESFRSFTCANRIMSSCEAALNPGVCFCGDTSNRIPVNPKTLTNQKISGELASDASRHELETRLETPHPIYWMQKTVFEQKEHLPGVRSASEWSQSFGNFILRLTVPVSSL